MWQGLVHFPAHHVTHSMLLFTLSFRFFCFSFSSQHLISSISSPLSSSTLFPHFEISMSMILTLLVLFNAVMI